MSRARAILRSAIDIIYTAVAYHRLDYRGVIAGGRPRLAVHEGPVVKNSRDLSPG